MNCSEPKCGKKLEDGEIVHSIPASDDAEHEGEPMKARYHEACAPAARRVFIHVWREPDDTPVARHKGKRPVGR